MRTTLTLDDALYLDLKRAAEASDASFKDTVNKALRAGLAAMGNPPKRKKRFRSPTFDLGPPLVNLDKALSLAGKLENEEVIRKMRTRK